MAALDRSDDRPLYQQLADVLRAEIKRGRLRPGQKLRSAKDLADEYGVGVNTVEGALGVLSGEGRIRREQRVGAFVAEPPERAVVPVPGPAVITARMPDAAEARRLGIARTGVPVLIVDRAGQVSVLAADSCEVHVPGPHGA
ncbi:GntR family transcriptional regulator [Nonomuraea sp. NPDC050536]|uniref:GntR family transcriptional regulator n=1 Tax=Nonomuraea sp. NPDC050536 TaxID=3364366 RepID=UPI0037CC1DB5